ncbi:hypothetical protein PFISCL1PPCAC_22303, partial [Pristionchus fissidentatus]
SPPSNNVKMSTAGDASVALSREIRWVVESISTIEEEYLESPKMELLGMEWYLLVAKERLRSVDMLTAYLCCAENYSNFWSVDADFEIELFDTAGKSATIKKYTKRYDCKISSWGGNIIEWAKLFDENENLINDDKITIEARFSLTNIKGFRKNTCADFTDANDPRHDVTLIVEGKKLHVSKQFLALHSSYFNTMFYGEFSEKNKKEIEI